MAKLKLRKKKLKEELNENEKKLKKINKQLEELKQKEIGLTKSVCYLKKKCEGRDEHFSELRAENESTIETTESEISKLRRQNEDLEKLSQLFDDSDINGFEDGRYSNELLEVNMELALRCNVSLSQIDNVIRIVLKKLAGKHIGALPSKSPKSRIILEARHVADYQVATALLQDRDTSTLVGNTLHGDGTAMFHKHCQGFQVTTAGGEALSIGMLQMGGASAEDLVQALTSKLEDLAHSLSMANAEEREVKVKKLIVSIKSTMSDRAVVNKKFNEEFDNLREKVAKEVLSNWDELTESEKESVLHVGYFPAAFTSL